MGQSCSDHTDCVSCTTNNCTYCELPDAIDEAVCHSSFDPLNPCSFFCPEMNVHNPPQCPKPVPNSYSPDVASQMLLLSTSSYSEVPGVCFTNLPNLAGWELFQTFSTDECDPRRNSCFGFTAVSTTKKSIAIVFRGTAGFDQIIFEVLVGLVPSAQWPHGGNVAPYFNDAFNRLYPQVRTQLIALKTKYPSFEVYVAGHSLGGSLATLCASALVGQKLIPNPMVYTFGEPRTGDVEFAKAFATQVTNAWRVINFIDPVPHVPFCLELLVNGPVPVCLPCPESTRGYFFYHRATEVWYNISSNNFTASDPHIVCLTQWPLNEGLGCSNGFVDYGEECFHDINKCVHYHSSYFGVAAGDCGSSNCTNSVACNVPKQGDIY